MLSYAQFVRAVAERPRARTASPGNRAARAFTLLELLVAVSIIAVVVAILVPVISGARNSARAAQTLVLMNTVTTAVGQFKTDHRRAPGVFTQQQLASPSNTTGFTQSENAILDLAGGVDPNATISDEGNFEVSLEGRRVKVNVRMIASTKGPGYLPLTVKGAGTGEPEANGLASARPIVDQIVDRSRGSAGNVSMPDLLDAWGRPILIWQRNEYAGERPAFAATYSNTGDSDVGARFYWATNRGYLESTSQMNASALGGGIVEDKRLRSMEAILGDPLVPDPASATAGNIFRPLSGRGDTILHTTGRDGVFLTNGGELRMEYRYTPGGTYVSRAVPLVGYDRFWRPADGLDDVVHTSN